MFLVYAFIIFCAFSSFREIILDNANVNTLDFPSCVVVFIAAGAVPDIIIVVGKFFISQLKQLV